MEKHKYKDFVSILMAVKNDELNVRYHYWAIMRDDDGKKEAYEIRCGKWLTDLTERNHDYWKQLNRYPVMDKTIEDLKKLVRLKDVEDRLITVAEYNGEVGIAVLHPKDIFTKKLGRVIALGRLKKKLGVISK